MLSANEAAIRSAPDNRSLASYHGNDFRWVARFSGVKRVAGEERTNRRVSLTRQLGEAIMGRDDLALRLVDTMLFSFHLDPAEKTLK